MPVNVSAPPVVAVIMPAYNASRYLFDSTSSVLSQTLPDFQLVIVNDGSTDSTLELARSIHDERVVVLSAENGGPARARNLGVEASAPSEFIAFLDADDAWLPSKLERQIAFLRRNPQCVAVGCFMRYMTSAGQPMSRTGVEVGPREMEMIRRAELFPFPTSSLVVRRNALLRVDGFDETFRRAGSEDLDFLARLARVGTISCIPEVLGAYRIHSESAMASDRIRISRETRFVRMRIIRRANGKDLTWTEFEESYSPTLNDRRQEWRTMLFRTAGLWYTEGNWLKALAYGAIAFVLSPLYVASRASRYQRHRRLTSTEHLDPELG